MHNPTVTRRPTLGRPICPHAKSFVSPHAGRDKGIDSMLDRRAFLAGLGGAALSPFAGGASAQTTLSAATERDRALDALLSAWFEADLIGYPEQATNLGIDVGERAQLRHRLSDASIATAFDTARQAVERYRELRSFGRDGLSAAGQLNYDVAEFRWSIRAEGARFRYGRGVGYPYVVSQLGGNYYWSPDFIENQHPVTTRDDAEAYIARLDDLARVLGEETERIRHDAGLGVIPPDFVIDRTLSSLIAMRRIAPAEHPLVRALERKTRERGIVGDWDTRALGIVAGPVAAALDGQIETLTQLRARAVGDPGVWRLPDGEAFYALALRSQTTASLDAGEIHRMGLAQVAELEAQLDPLLRAQGYSSGTIGQRLNALARDPRFLYPNTDAGRAEILADLERQMADLAPLLPRMFSRLPRANVVIRRVPPAIEAGAPFGYYSPPSLDGSRPGAFYINLRDTAEWPKHSLPSFTYHEVMPGHHLQIALVRESASMPLYRQTLSFPGYGEGWGVYAEQVADELGVYVDDPLGRIGFLYFYLFRAARLVVDTGLNQRRWSRERAIRYMIDVAAQPESLTIREVERYGVWPGQACAYKVGQTVIAQLRADTQQRMGQQFDIRRFHDLVLLGGPVPLTVLARRVREAMASR
jgi:uncharacterized protein (DUF885 family)